MPVHLPALTSLRFIAAFAVLVLHFRDLLGPLPGWLIRGIVGGQYGVTFFFVLSGFILSYRYRGWFAGGVVDARYWRFQRLANFMAVGPATAEDWVWPLGCEIRMLQSSR